MPGLRKKDHLLPSKNLRLFPKKDDIKKYIIIPSDALTNNKYKVLTLSELLKDIRLKQCFIFEGSMSKLFNNQS